MSKRGLAVLTTVVFLVFLFLALPTAKPPPPEPVKAPVLDPLPLQPVPREFQQPKEPEPEDRAAPEKRIPDDEAEIEDRLALPEPMMALHGAWDGYQLNDDRLEAIDAAIGRQLQTEEIELLRADYMEQGQESALAVGEYRLGELTEDEAMGIMEDAHAAFRASVLEITGLPEDRFDRIFRLGGPQ